jgi:hypothetical protein
MELLLKAHGIAPERAEELFKHGATPQLNRGKVRMFNYGQAWTAGKVHPLPGPW